MHNAHLLESKEFGAIAEILGVQQEEELFGMDWYNQTCYAVESLGVKHEKVGVDEVVNQLNHLDLKQREDLKKVLSEHTKLFDGTLGVYRHSKFHIDLMPGAVP